MKCESCGAAIHSAADFCRVCGTDAPPRAESSTPRLRGIDSLRALVPAMPSRAPRQARSARRSGSVAPEAALHLPASALSALRVPAVSRRALMVAGAVAAVIAIALVLVNIDTGAPPDVTGRELAAARQTIAERDAKLASLEGTLATNTQAQSALQTSAQQTQQANDTLRQERDAAQQQVKALEVKVTQTEASLKEQLTLTTLQQNNLSTLSSCLNGTAVALAFGRTERWNSADLALNAVAGACKAAEPLLRR